jgi:hypothetical protein
MISTWNHLFYLDSVQNSTVAWNFVDSFVPKAWIRKNCIGNIVVFSVDILHHLNKHEDKTNSNEKRKEIQPDAMICDSRSSA